MTGHVDVILVTASIALGDTPRSASWSRGTLALGFARRSPLLVAHGDADGGDAHAEAAASAMLAPTLAFPAGERAAWRIGLCEPPPEHIERVPLPPYGPHPIARNAAMVAWLRAVRDAGASVLVVALFAPWCARYRAARGGTLWTLKAAIEAKLPTAEKVCPMEYGER